MEYKGIEYLRNKLEMKRFRVLKRYEYYEMKNIQKQYSRMMPKGFEHLTESLGWCAKAVDTLADRLVFKGIKNDNFGLNDIFKYNNSDILFDSAILSAMISSCSFVYISAGENQEPRLQVIDGANATGILDPITRMLNEGYAVLERDRYGQPTLEAYFTKEKTIIYKGKEKNEEIKNVAQYPLLVPFIYKPSDSRPFGHSRISRACMSITDTALRELKRLEVSSEYYSFPQKYITGLSNDPDNEPFNSANATMSSFLALTKDEDGDAPKLGQFTQQSMTPYLESLKTQASLFAGETGLTIEDLGFQTSNPSSSESIKASHENLRLAGRKAQRTFNTSILNVGLLSASIRDNFAYNREAILESVPKWYPIFELDTSALSGVGDAIIKINQAVPNAITKDVIEELTGIDLNIEDVADIDSMDVQDE